jgi:diaminohydroxyphosphoribosylaminopyrimidine deaminase/5-amino-6-(5-phosphoribosylamino)uracil reductase
MRSETGNVTLPVIIDGPEPAVLAPIRRAFRAAIDAAVEHIGATAPNPPVGCALLDASGQILVIAAHARAGTAHAEAHALALAREHGLLEHARTAVVTLEPCNHTGRTPPCSEALRASPVREVWIGVEDPHPLASGGSARLREEPDARAVFRLADFSALRAERDACAALIAPFMRRVADGRAWLTVKQALDVRVGTETMIPPAGQTVFTRRPSLILAHRLRRATDAIVTGIGTVLADAPSFTVRHVPDHPARHPRLLVVCDRHGRVPPAWRREREAAGLRVLVTGDLAAVPSLLAAHDVSWALVEAGPVLLAEVRRLGLWDDWLTIRHDGQGPDSISIRCQRPVSPLQLLPPCGDPLPE